MCAYKLNNARYENLYAHTVAVTKLHLLKKEQSIAYIYIFKIFPSTHFKSCRPYRLGVEQLIEQPLERPSYCDVRAYGKKRKKARCSYSPYL